MASNEEYIRKNKVAIVDQDKNTKLHYAAALGNIEEIAKVIAKRQKIDPENYLGWTPLMMAVRNSNSMAVDILLTKGGADATKTNKFGMNVLLLSVTSGDLDLVKRILNHLLSGGVSRRNLQKVFSPVSLALLFGHNDIFKYLLDRTFDPNAATCLTDITPAMFAAAVGNNKAIKKLIQYQADMDRKNHLGKTALDILQSKHHKIDMVAKNQHNAPLLLISPCTPNAPFFHLTPYPTMHTGNALSGGIVRKSSNTATPNFQEMLMTPNFSPITPQLMPQMFFPPNFSTGNFVNPAVPYQSNTFLDNTASPSLFLSPFLSQ